MEILVITGMSGAGKSQALNVAEDFGYFSMDNLPPSLLPKFVELSANADNVNKVAVVLDTRSGKFFEDFFSSLEELSAIDIKYKILFLDANESVIIKRYKEMRRPHPLDTSILEGYKKEKKLLREIRKKADYILDTSKYSTAKLKEELAKILKGDLEKRIIISVVSFGFKNGILLDGDLIFDVRFLPNPFYIPELKNLDGENEETKNYVMKWEQTQEFLTKTMDMLEFLIPHYTEEGKALLVVGFGCTGGFHRSVAISKEIAHRLSEKGYEVILSHRDRKWVSKMNASDKKVVFIGGGTGLSTILRGLKNFTEEITAIVTMADDGGGSGIIRKDMGLLPPGDIRNCLSALSNTEPTLEKLLQYRFEEGMLKGQNFGNLLIVALNNIYGSFECAIKEVSNVLNITGKVYPVTVENVHLVAQFENGDKCIGESSIPKIASRLGTSIVEMSLFPHTPYAFSKSLEAIEEADIIVLGPGSLYTSVIPNLLVRGINEALKKARGKRVFVANCMTQRGETENFNLADHIKALEKHSFEGIVQYCISNNKIVDEDILRIYYEKDYTVQVIAKDSDKEFFKDKKIQLIEGDFVEVKEGLIRHDANKVSNEIMAIVSQGKRENIVWKFSSSIV